MFASISRSINAGAHIIASLFIVLAAALFVASSAAASGEVKGFDNASSSYKSDSLVVGFDPETSAASGSERLKSAAVGKVTTGGPRSAVVKVKSGTSLKSAARKLAKREGVRYVKPNFIARASDAFVPNDPGVGGPTGWRAVQWNFVGKYGVNVLPAWGALRDLGAEGGRGVTVAVIDTGVAYENRGRFRRSPDLVGVSISNPYDFISRRKTANDRNGHGTHVASTIFQTTNNGVGVTGIAYGATLMPIRALNSRGLGDEITVARAIRYATNRGAKIINLSVEFDVRLNSRDLPAITAAMRYARVKGVLVIAAAGNQQARRVAYPARSKYALAVGATTAGGCLAEYSDVGRGLDIVAPGGGADSSVLDTRSGSSDRSNCRFGNSALPIRQITFGRNVKKFGLPGNYQGTSMASPHVAGAAALVIASGKLGPSPKPAFVAERLQSTARDLGFPGYDTRYGHGLLDIGAAVTNP
ncbi:MAG: S8 family serine peptidase [Solirubrobacterales bacterium]